MSSVKRMSDKEKEDAEELAENEGSLEGALVTRFSLAATYVSTFSWNRDFENLHYTVPCLIYLIMCIAVGYLHWVPAYALQLYSGQPSKLFQFHKPQPGSS